VQVSPNFSLALNTSDAIIVEKMAKETGIGRWVVSGKTTRWTAGSVEDCTEISEYIQKYISDSMFQHTQKYQSYLLWSECLEMIRHKEHFNKEGMRVILKKREEINGPSRCKSAEEIMKHWKYQR